MTFPVPTPQAGAISLAWGQQITEAVNELDARMADLPKAMLRRTSAFSHTTSATWMQVTFQEGSESQPGMIDLSASTITIPVTGTWLVMFRYNHALNGTGSARGSMLNVNNTDANTNVRMQQMEAVQGIGPVSVSFTTSINFVAGDVVRVWVYQNTGGTLNSSTYMPELSVRLLPG